MASHIFPGTLQTTVNCYSETVRVHNESRLNNQIPAKANALQLCTQSHYRMSQLNCQLSNLTMESVHLAMASTVHQIKWGLKKCQLTPEWGENQAKWICVSNTASAGMFSFVCLPFFARCQCNGKRSKAHLKEHLASAFLQYALLTWWTPWNWAHVFYNI